DPARTSPYRFYQFWLNSDDRDVERLLKVFTFLPLDQITAVLSRHAKDPGRREAQRVLAADLTERIHGGELCRSAVAASEILFGGTELARADAATLEVVRNEVPQFGVTPAELERGFTLIEALVASGCASSKSEARRGLASGGYSLNGVKVTSDRTLTRSD